MKIIDSRLCLLFSLILALPYFTFTQDNPTFDLTYDVYRVFTPLSIDKETLVEANTLLDLNEHYTHSWVKEYTSVVITTTNNGKRVKAISSDHLLSQDQKDIMKNVDNGAGISVKVKYLPENKLKNNSHKEIDFTFTVNPEIEARIPNGGTWLKSYIKETVIDKVARSSFAQYNLTAVKFSIDEKGAIVEPDVFQSSGDKEVDSLLLETVCKMPSWEPAQFSDGTKVKQEFVLAIGDISSCAVNLINIRQELE